MGCATDERRATAVTVVPEKMPKSVAVIEAEYLKIASLDFGSRRQRQRAKCLKDRTTIRSVRSCLACARGSGARLFSHRSRESASPRLLVMASGRTSPSLGTIANPSYPPSRNGLGHRWTKAAHERFLANASSADSEEAHPEISQRFLRSGTRCTTDGASMIPTQSCAFSKWLASMIALPATKVPRLVFSVM